MSSYEAWQSGEPIFARMPDENNSYRSNYVVKILLDYWDKVLSQCARALDGLPRQFDPEFCDVNWLDFLAPLCGWTAPYWDTNYPESAKRVLLKNSFSFIWAQKGSRDVLSFILNALGINHIIYIQGSFILGQSTLGTDQLGLDPWDFAVLLPREYIRGGYEFTLAEKMTKLFSPCWCRRTVAYDSFYADLSVAGDPVYDIQSFDELDVIQADSGNALATNDNEILEI